MNNHRDQSIGKKLPSIDGIMNLITHAEMERDPIVIRLMKAIALDPEDEDLINDVLERIQPALIRKKLNPDPFAPNPKGSDVDGLIKIGRVKGTHAVFGLNPDELNQHTLIAGRAGSGKTTSIYVVMIQLLQHRIPFWAFDFKQDYRHLLRHSKMDIHVFNWKNFKFNPLRPPSGCGPTIWMQAFTNVFAQAYWLMAGSKGLIQHHINRLYQDYGVFENKGIYPSLHDLQYAVNRHHLQRQFGREAGFMESTKNRLEECILPLKEMFDCDKGFPIDELLDKPVVFELDGLLNENQIFLTTIIMRYIFEYRISNKHRSSLRHIILFDEGKMVYDRNRDNIQGLGQNEVAQFTSQIREFGEGLVVADQMPTALSDVIKANVHNIICLSQSGGKNIHDMASAMDLKEEQISRLTQLVSDKGKKQFEAIIKMSGKCLTPFIIEIIPFTVEKSITEYQLAARVQPLIEELNKKTTPRTPYNQILAAKYKETEATKYQPAGQKTKEDLKTMQDKTAETEEREQRETKREGTLTNQAPSQVSPKNTLWDEIKTRPDERKKETLPAPAEKVEGNILIRILTDIREHPFSDQKERIERLNLSNSSSTNNKYFKELEKEELVKAQKISLGSRRGVKVFYEITEKGRQYAKMNAFTIPGKGDFKHKFWQHTIKKYFEGKVSNPEVEKRYGNKNVDVGFNMNERKVAVEIELSPDHLIENITKDLEAGCDFIIIAATSKTTANNYKTKIRQQSDQDVLNKIEFRTLTDFLQ